MSQERNPYASPGADSPAPPTRRRTSMLAVSAFVLSLLVFIPLAPLVGAILGIVATVKLSGQAAVKGGRGLAIAAIPVGVMMFLIIQMMMAAVAIPAFVKFTRKSKTVEATETLDKIKAGARSYYQSDHYDDQGNLLPPAFPGSSAGWIPSIPCCKSSRSPRCEQVATQWAQEPWKSLQLSLQDAGYYQYRFTSRGSGKAATYEAEARGDLDCDGSYSSYRITGQVDEEREVMTRGPIIINEIE